MSESLLYTESENLDTWLPNSKFIRPGIYTTDPHSQVSNKETFCPGQGKRHCHFCSLIFSPALGQLMHVHMHSPSPAVRWGFPAFVPNKESAHGVYANYLTADSAPTELLEVSSESAVCKRSYIYAGTRGLRMAALHAVLRREHC